MDLIQSRVLNSAACRPHYQISLSLPGILLPGYRLSPAYKLENSNAEAGCGLSRGAATANRGALRHNSSEFEAEVKNRGQVTCMLMHKGLSWYDAIGSPTFQSKKVLERKHT